MSDSRGVLSISTSTTFQGLIQTLNRYWAEQGCVLVQPLDLEVGAGTFHPATFFACVGSGTVECCLCAA